MYFGRISLSIVHCHPDYLNVTRYSDRLQICFSQFVPGREVIHTFLDIWFNIVI